MSEVHAVKAQLDAVLTELHQCRQRLSALEDSLTAHRAETTQVHQALQRDQTQALAAAQAVETALVLLLQATPVEGFDLWVAQMHYLANYSKARSSALQALGERAVQLQEIRTREGISHTHALQKLDARRALAGTCEEIPSQPCAHVDSQTARASSLTGTNIGEPS